MKKIKIGFLWHNVSSDNLGVGALAISNMLIVDSILKDLNIEADFYTLGDYEAISKENHFLVEKQINRTFTHIPICVKKIITNYQAFKEFKNIINNVDYLFDNGAGDSFSDIYGIRRFIVQAFTKIYAILLNKKLILCPQTIGPFNSYIAQLIAKMIIKRSFLTFARDSISFELGKKFGDCKLSTDVALTMPYQIMSFDNQFIHVGLNVSGLLWHGGYTKDNQFGINHSYPEFIEEIIKFFLSIPSVKVHLVAHVVAPDSIEDDYAACEELHQKFNDLILAPRFTNPIEVKNYISGMDFFTGGRMHSTIAAFSTGVPVVPYAYSRKFQGLYNTFGYSHILEAKKLSLEEAIDYMKTSFYAKDKLREDIISSKTKVDELTDRYISFIKANFQKSINAN